ncbi:MAG TPA: UDP-N-acetylmuramoyl-tripeptide--D-alanyl-D-alanine ligase [Caulobacteraceae bacterium]|jgi:UDP-N-acetylmuramoyl-tripeptide--D-alanyl-D-alanine ligase
MTEPLWTRGEILEATGGSARGADFAALGVAIDSRQVTRGDLFVALAGERDGHDYIPAALEAGACASLASRPGPGSAIIVEDTLAALTAMGEAARERAPYCRRGAVTGSVGKTGVTQAVLGGLEMAGEAHGSEQSFNNHIGVPLTLARMPRGARRAVFEMGMNHAGEIAPLSRLVRPHAVAITNVEAVHVENFADGEAGVARAKAEIFAGLEGHGVAILNADNHWTADLTSGARSAGAKVRTFGTARTADARLVRFSPTPDGARVESRVDGAPLDYSLRQSAPHWGPMSLCAVLMLQALGLDLDLAARALAAFQPLPGRGVSRAINAAGGAFTLIDESYNASPVSMAAALAGLGAREAAGRRIAALTDMLELGAGAPERHAALAGAIETARVDLVFCAGPLMHSLWEVLPPARRGAWAQTAAELAPDLTGAVASGDVVMAKGSKASKASLLVAALAALGEPA